MARESHTFESLYRASSADMTRLAFLITGSLAAAEDITHDSFVAIRRRWDSIEHPRAYLRATVVNRSRSHLRRVRTERRAPLSPPQVVPPEDIDETWQLIQQLAPRPRTALVLHYYADLPVDEIARIMRTRPGTVKSLLHRGRETLRTKLS